MLLRDLFFFRNEKAVYFVRTSFAPSHILGKHIVISLLKLQTSSEWYIEIIAFESCNVMELK